MALRLGYFPGSVAAVEHVNSDSEWPEFFVRVGFGRFRISISAPEPTQPIVRCTVRLTLATDLRLPFLPRDLYLRDARGKLLTARGKVEAAQRGLNSGLVFATRKEDDWGSFLYFQNLTVLNEYFRLTETKPDGCVGGEWPEIGYLPPVSLEKSLPCGKEIVLSDVFLHVSDTVPENEQQSARVFLDLLAGVYRNLEKPPTEFHFWPGKAEATLHDLQHSPKATVKEHGHVYLHPYTDSEYPDSMVQLTVLMALNEFAAWKQEAVSFAISGQARSTR